MSQVKLGPKITVLSVSRRNANRRALGEFSLGQLLASIFFLFVNFLLEVSLRI